MIQFSDLGVLYVEDDPQSRAVMEILLIHTLSVTKFAMFEDSTDFEARLAQIPFEPDIVFLDIHMRPIGGFEMLKILRTRPIYARRPIVALTASVMNEEVEQLKAAGFNGVIPKPINLDTFPSTIQQILNGQEIWRVLQ